MAAFKIRKHETNKGDFRRLGNPGRSFENDSSDPSPVRVQKVISTTADEIRLLMRRVPHPVAVITSNLPPHNPPENFCGMTVSSFNTVCLEPKVVVSFNVKQPSATYDAIQASGTFDVHLMNSTVQAAAVADHFATGRGREAVKEDISDSNDGESSSSPPSTSGLKSPISAQIIRPNDEAMFTLQCKLLDPTVKVADHVIVLGEVLTHRLPPTTDEWYRTSLGLCYVNRRYRRPGRIQILPAQRGHVSGSNSATGATTGSKTQRSNPEEQSPNPKQQASKLEDDSSPEEETIPFSTEDLYLVMKDVRTDSRAPLTPRSFTRARPARIGLDCGSSLSIRQPRWAGSSGIRPC